MVINNKTFKQWTADDLTALISNDDFRESQTLDFKRTFEFLEAEDRKQKAKAKDEFRNDVCSLANADGGDLIFGISERNGVAAKIMPISIANTDKFELDLRNALLPIQPSVPAVEFSFISVDNGYVVVVHIEKGIFKPYMTVEDETVFRFFVRHGNRKSAMSYSEISNDFLYAASLSSEIKRFRLERLSEILEDNEGMFGVIHVVPASFMNPADFVPMCDWGKTGKLPLPIELNNYIRGMMVPNVDGVWFPSDDGLRDFELLRLFNNGSVELKMDLCTQKVGQEEWLVSHEFIGAIGDIVEGTAEIYKSLGRKSTVYICTSIIGCKGYRNYGYSVGIHSVSPKIDRDRILCSPIEIKDITDAENVQAMIEECKKMTRYALGTK
ncbi:ATP-binding protein [Roseburia hominis]